MSIENVFEGNEVLIGKGRTAKVYKIEGNPESFAAKIFSPNYVARPCNFFFYKSPHPLSTENGHSHAYWKRRLAHRLGKFIDGNAQIVDGIEQLEHGIMSQFIEGYTPTKNEIQLVHAKTQKLEETFDDIGMPTLSFSSKHPFSRHNNFIVDLNNQIHIVDYEQSVPMPDIRGNFGYDIIYFDEVYRFIKDNRLQILDKLGIREIIHLDEAFELAKQYQTQLDIRPRALTRFAKPLSRGEIDKTLERLYNEGKISEEELLDYRSGKSGDNLRLGVMNLGVHMSIGLATPPYISILIPPLFFASTVARPTWTAANWVYYTINREYEKRKIHSPTVMLVSALPLPFPISAISNGAYLIPIMEENPHLGLAIGDNLVKEFSGKSLEEAMQNIGSYSALRPFVKGYGAISNTSFGGWVQEKMLGHNTKKAHDILLDYAMKGTRQN